MPRFSGFAPPRQVLAWAWNLCSVKRKLTQEPETQRQFHKKCRGEILRTEGMAKGCQDEEREDGKLKVERLISWEIGFLKRGSKTGAWIQVASCYRRWEWMMMGERKGIILFLFFSPEMSFYSFQCSDNELMFWVNCFKSSPFTFSKSSFLEKNS